MTALKKTLISIFIFAVFLSMLRVHFPMEKRIFQEMYRPIDPFLSALSIYQSWTMFAENPSRVNSHLSAEIFFKDGSKENYNFPKSEELSLFEKYGYGEKYRKIISEVISLDENTFLWTDVAKFALKEIKIKYPTRTPRIIQLKRSWFLIPDISERFLAHTEKGLEYQEFKFFTYEVVNVQSK